MTGDDRGLIEELAGSGVQFRPRPDWKRVVRRRILAAPTAQSTPARRRFPALASASVALTLLFLVQTQWHRDVAQEGEFFEAELAEFRSELDRRHDQLLRHEKKMTTAFAALQTSKSSKAGASRPPVPQPQRSVKMQRSLPPKARTQGHRAKRAKTKTKSTKSRSSIAACEHTNDPLCGL